MMRLRVIAVGLFALLATMLGAGTAGAHATVIASNPADKSQIVTAPERVSVTFSEAMQEDFAALTVVGPDGNLWTRSSPTVEGSTISAELGELGPVGEYTIAFRVTSADGHPVAGTRTFTLTTAGTGTPGEPAVAADSTESSGVTLWPFIVAGALVFAGGLWFALRTPRNRG